MIHIELKWKKIEKFIKSREKKFMREDILIEEEKQQIKTNSIHNYNSLCQKLKLEEDQSCVNDYDFDEREMSEISFENEVDC